MDQELDPSPTSDSFEMPTPSGAFNLDVEQAAELLGVSRTRLSQITSRGLLNYQRKKVGIRNRLFYRREDILTYMRRQMGASAVDEASNSVRLEGLRELTPQFNRESTEPVLPEIAGSIQAGPSSFKKRQTLPLPSAAKIAADEVSQDFLLSELKSISSSLLEMNERLTNVESLKVSFSELKKDMHSKIRSASERKWLAQGNIGRESEKFIEKTAEISPKKRKKALALRRRFLCSV